MPQIKSEKEKFEVMDLIDHLSMAQPDSFSHRLAEELVTALDIYENEVFISELGNDEHNPNFRPKFLIDTLPSFTG